MKTVKVLTIAAVAIPAAFVSATARVVPRFPGSAVTPPIAEGPSPQRLDPSFADSLLIIGTANNGAASQFGQLNAFGNGRSGSVADPGRTLGSTRETEFTACCESRFETVSVRTDRFSAATVVVETELYIGFLQALALLGIA